MVRITTGGGVYASGATLAATDITVAANGDISNSAGIDFGATTAALGTITHWSALRGTALVAWSTTPSTVMAIGDGFEINSGSMQFNGSVYIGRSGLKFVMARVVFRPAPFYSMAGV